MNIFFRRYIWVTLAAGLFTACDQDAVDDVSFDVKVEKATIQAGEKANFLFEGNPDYIVFYPGTKDCSYANHERTNILLDKIAVSCTVEQMYAEPKAYSGQMILHAYISTDYDGSNTAAAIKAATWTEISGTEDGTLKMPVVPDKAATLSVSSELDISQYMEKKFYLGFKYAAGPNTYTSNYGKPRIHVKNLTLDKIEPDGNVISMTDAINEWGFSAVQVNTSGSTASAYKVEKNQLTIFPDKNTEKERDVEVWMISQQLDPTDVQPDKGEPIKSINARLASYEYTYDKAGTYTATFIATNANMWGQSQVIKEVTVTVNPAE